MASTFIYVICLFCQLGFLVTEQVLDTRNDDFDFDGLPGVTYEFKVEVHAGHEQCFYQRVKQGARLHISYQVSVKFLH